MRGMSARDYQKSLRISDNKRTQLLKRLTDESRVGAEDTRRESPRIDYQLHNVALRIFHPGGGVGNFIVSTRNLSSGGISFLHSGFLHNNTEVRAVLPKMHGGGVEVHGKVVMCRHVEGVVHEIGVALFEKLDLLDFVDPGETPLVGDNAASFEIPQIHGEALCLVSDDAEAMLLEHHLKATGLDPVRVSAIGAAVDLLKRQSFDMAIVDVDGDDTVEPITKMIQEGFSRSILALTAESAATRGKEALDAGAEKMLHKPYDTSTLLSVVSHMIGDAADGSKEIFSTMAADENMAKMVEQYLETVGTTARKLEDSIAAGEIDDVRAACQSYKGSASGYGFPQLSEVARRAVTALDASCSIEESMSELRRLSSMAGRLRAGTPAEKKAG